MADLPLLRGFDPDATFAHRAGARVTTREFLLHVAEVARLLPGRTHVFNLCADRYHFAVGLAAALVRGQITLLPPNTTPDFLAQLQAAYPATYSIADAARNDDAFTDFVMPERSADGACPDMPTIRASQAAAIAFTSGSTGEPVPHAKTWGTLVGSGRAETERLGLEGSGAAVVGTVPPQHMYGLESTVLMPMQGGLALHAGRPFFPADVCADLNALPRPRILVTTPVHLRALVADGVAAPAIDLIVCATAALAPQLALAAETRFAAPVREIYGCTESGQIATRRTVESPEWQALPGLSLRQDEKGTWVRGGHVEVDTLLSDIIELNGRSRFLLHGRNADLVNIAGKRTSLATLNHHLNSIPGVEDAAFIIPEEGAEGVSRLAAFVVAPGLTAAAVMQALRVRIDPAFLPRRLSFVAALPRNTTGKLPRAALAAMASELATRDA